MLLALKEPYISVVLRKTLLYLNVLFDQIYILNIRAANTVIFKNFKYKYIQISWKVAYLNTDQSTITYLTPTLPHEADETSPADSGRDNPALCGSRPASVIACRSLYVADRGWENHRSRPPHQL